MLGCYFTATGADFDVDSFLAGTEMDPDAIYHRGAPISERLTRHIPRLPKVYDASGFWITVNPDYGILSLQIVDAIEFLKYFQKDLTVLANHRSVTDLRLVFTFCPEYSIATESFPPELITRSGALRIGFEISYSRSDGSEGDAD